MTTWSCGSRSQPTVASSVTVTPYCSWASTDSPIAQRHGDGVAEDQEPHRVGAVGTGALQRGVLRRRSARAGGERPPGRRPSRRPGPRCRAPAGGGASTGRPTHASRRQAAPSRPRTPQRVTPHRPPRCHPPSPGREAPPDRPGRRGGPAPACPTPCRRPFAAGLEYPSTASRRSGTPDDALRHLHAGDEVTRRRLGRRRCRWPACRALRSRGWARPSWTLFHTQAPASMVGRRPSAAVMKAAA